MNSQSHRRRRAMKTVASAVLAMAAVCAASAAEIIVERPRYRTEIIEVAPPAAQTEVIGVAAHRGWVRRDGYWDWVGGKHVWVQGAWIEPRPGYRWVPHAWVREGRGYRLREGYWAHR